MRDGRAVRGVACLLCARSLGLVRALVTVDPAATARRRGPALPFGFGRSYTTFTLSNGTVMVAGEELVASVDVSNTGAMGGRETVQVYVGAPDTLGPRAPRDLPGFAQVEVAPGATVMTLALGLERRIW